MLKKEFPQGRFVEDVPFTVSYGKNRLSNILNLIWQFPCMLRQLYREHQHLRKVMEKYQFDVVIADSRYGMFHRHAISIFISHQLNIKFITGSRFINFLNHYFINKFDVCWVPDYEDANLSIAGELSKRNTHTQVQYVGILSRANQVEVKPTDKILFLLSGAEPQRSILERLIVSKIKQDSLKAILVRGCSIGRSINMEDLPDVELYDLVDASQLQGLVSECSFVVCRSGYSTIMDLIVWKKKAVLIPTPGQYEQEYLADYLEHKKWFCKVEQKDFLHTNLEQINNYTTPEFKFTTGNFAQLVQQLIENKR
ncbi:MAG: hypothetical protein IT238_02160 [Bacteroidia bacterium]|nr:hypothetical protein [Bacteroidia bacterium]MCZ2249394.1 hypothetical protein [Bacteroidia bacterium]